MKAKFKETTQVLSYWSPTIFSSALLAVTLKYTSNSFESNNTDAKNNTDYLSDLYCTPVYLVGGLFAATFISNAIFGRRPNDDKHHNPLSYRMFQDASAIMPSVLAGLNEIGTFAASTVFGDKADASNHIATTALSFFEQGGRVVLIGARLYDHAMDRSPGVVTEGNLVIDGKMTLFEKIAMDIENTAIPAVEFCIQGLYVAMTWGFTQFTVNDKNKLAVIALLYAAADIIEANIIWPVNEYAYYAKKWTGIPVIHIALKTLGFDSLALVQGVNPMSVDQISDVINHAKTLLIKDINAVGVAVAGAASAMGHVMAQDINAAGVAAAQAISSIGHVMAQEANAVGHNLVTGIESLGHEVIEGTSTWSWHNLLGRFSCCSSAANDVLDQGHH